MCGGLLCCFVGYSHNEPDEAVDKLFSPSAIADDRDRATHLLSRYEELSAPLLATANTNPKRESTKKTN